MRKKIINIIVYIGIVLFALAFIFIGNRIASRDISIEFDDDFITAEAKIIEIVDISIEELNEWMSFTTITFEAVITRGNNRNEAVIATQQILIDSVGYLDREVMVGNRVILTTHAIHGNQWFFSDFVRINQIIILGAIFIALLLIFGRFKGLNSILSLGFTCVAIFAVFIPSILSGKNIYLSSIIICAYTIIITLFILNGINRKSLAAVGGCFGGIVAAGILTLIMNNALLLTGVTSNESIQLTFLPTDNPVNLRAIIFASIIIGATGAIMDVAVSISSALSELKTQAPDLSFSMLYKSGINIGRDIMGSMTNTLVLAYIGSSLTVILLLVVYTTSFTELFNREMVVVEILQALIGSLGILFTMPLTALICAVLFSQKPKIKTVEENDAAPVVEPAVETIPSIPEDKPKPFKPALEDFFGEKAGWGHETNSKNKERTQ